MTNKNTPEEASIVEYIPDTATMEARAKDLLAKLATVDPSKVHSFMGMVVTHEDDGSYNARAFVLGDDHSVATMLVSLAQIVKNGSTELNTPSDPNEVKH